MRIWSDYFTWWIFSYTTVFMCLRGNSAVNINTQVFDFLVNEIYGPHRTPTVRLFQGFTEGICGLSSGDRSVSWTGASANVCVGPPWAKWAERGSGQVTQGPPLLSPCILDHRVDLRFVGKRYNSRIYWSCNQGQFPTPYRKQIFCTPDPALRKVASISDR